ncbi:MAG: sugar ABC transporter permease [Trueperaceae bacterium]|nr:sugar ABC transporter permease [Trueperaceae bacterium]MCO5173178.1 sugar ABC transporter permease [Trueperaceae bacterium]MCW5818420.1 sugar ABC transporter permease [Trueperaceae bacterium]
MHQRRTILPLRTGLLFLGPAALFIGAFILLPFFWIAGVSFTNRSLTGATAANPQFVGLQNYLKLFDLSTFMNPGQFGSSLVITGQFVFWSAIVGQAVLGLLLAWFFYRRAGWVKESVQTLAIVAWIIPDVVVAFAWNAFLDYDGGTLNWLFGLFGLHKVDWLLAMPLLSIVLFNAWRGAAFSMLLFSSALGSIPPSYLETADVAGAGPWQRLKDIILPLIRTHIVTDLILITLWTFNTFGPFLLTGGGPAFRTEVVSVLTYRMAFKYFDFGTGSALGMVMMLINLGFALVYLGLLRRQGGSR